MIRRSPANRPLFSLGYQLRHLVDFLSELQAAGVHVVVDVRETPWSHKPGFSKGHLEGALAEIGIAYVHARFAGNPKELRRAAGHHQECLQLYDQHLESNPEVLSQLTELVAQFGEGLGVCFICYERHPGDCHRAILLERWAEHLGADLQVKHLATDGAPRLVK